MKITSRGKRYDTDKCKIIAERKLLSPSNNYSGTAYLGVASDGAYISWQDTNGQDLYANDTIDVVSAGDARSILEDMEMSEEQEAIAVEYGLVEIVK